MLSEYIICTLVVFTYIFCIFPNRVVIGSEDLTWGAEDDHNSEHNYYNSIPGKEPPLGGVQDSRVRDPSTINHHNGQIIANGQWAQVGHHWVLGANKAWCGASSIQC